MSFSWFKAGALLIGTSLAAAEAKEVVHFDDPLSKKDVAKLVHVGEEVFLSAPSPSFDVGMSGTGGIIGGEDNRQLRCVPGRDGEVEVVIVEVERTLI